MGRSFAGSKTAGRSSVNTSSASTSAGRKRAHSAVAVGESWGRFRRTSSSTYGVAIRVHLLAWARAKTSRDAPVADPLAASRHSCPGKTSLVLAKAAHVDLIFVDPPLDLITG